jgi:hypothetical protein
MLVTYLTATNIGHDAVRITKVHSIHRYSARIGGSNALHGATLALLGEMVGSQLPMLVKFYPDPTENFAHALKLEGVTVPTDVMVDAYFSLPTAENLVAQPTVAQGTLDMNLANFCPIPLAWAPYFLGNKSPYEALITVRKLVATMTDAGD